MYLPLGGVAGIVSIKPSLRHGQRSYMACDIVLGPDGWVEDLREGLTMVWAVPEDMKCDTVSKQKDEVEVKTASISDAPFRLGSQNVGAGGWTRRRH